MEIKIFFCRKVRKFLSPLLYKVLLIARKNVAAKHKAAKTAQAKTAKTAVRYGQRFFFRRDETMKKGCFGFCFVLGF